MRMAIFGSGIVLLALAILLLENAWVNTAHYIRQMKTREPYRDAYVRDFPRAVRRGILARWCVGLMCAVVSIRLLLSLIP